MEQARLHRLRETLVRRVEHLRAEGDVEIEGTSDGDLPAKPDEDAAPLTEMSQVIASKRNRARTTQLRQIEAALRRIDEEPEDFGLCDECDEDISLRRIELMPWVTLCIECQSKREGDGHRGPRKHLTDYD